MLNKRWFPQPQNLSIDKWLKMWGVCVYIYTNIQWNRCVCVYAHTHSGIGDFLIAQLVKESTCNRRPRLDSWVRKILWRRDRLPSPVFLGFPAGSAGEESPCNAGDLGSVPGLGRSPGEGKGYSLQYSGLEKSMDCIVHGVAKSGTQLSNFHLMG